MDGTSSGPTSRVVLLDIPTDSNSSHLPGAAMAPRLIREALYCDSSNGWSEAPHFMDVTNHPLFEQGMQVSDLQHIQPGHDGYVQIQKAINNITKEGSRVLALGGDHSITFPIVTSDAYATKDLTILHIDAHPDLYSNFQDNPYSHASPFARIMEERMGTASEKGPLRTHLIQIGIRTLNEHQRQQAENFNVEIVPMSEYLQQEQNVNAMLKRIEGPVYLSIDLDGLDPAYAPGVSHHEAGGLSTRQVINMIHSLPPQIVGADIVEYNPSRDVNGVTARVAAKLLKEVAANMLTTDV